MKAIMPVLDDSRKKPYYLQLYDYIKEAILKGEIRENGKETVMKRIISLADSDSMMQWSMTVR